MPGVGQQVTVVTHLGMTKIVQTDNPKQTQFPSTCTP